MIYLSQLFVNIYDKRSQIMTLFTSQKLIHLIEY